MNPDHRSPPRVGITMGDPAGIGPEIALAGYQRYNAAARPVVIGDRGVLERARGTLGSHLPPLRTISHPTAATADPDVIDVIDLDNVENHDWGVVRGGFGAAGLGYVERAIELAVDGEIDAITTAPLNKRALAAAGAEYPGHTELLAARTGTDAYAMLLVEGELRVSHVSTHVPLAQACELVTPERVRETIAVTADGLPHLGVTAPTIAVAGLNPHAGEGGITGDTEDEVLAPAIERARGAGYDVVGPESPDAVFPRAVAGAYDAVVAMYHDQGHIPVKLQSGDPAVPSGVNVTLGLPIVRTSVDHGTAFDIAGSGTASARSLVQAVRLAAEIAARE